MTPPRAPTPTDSSASCPFHVDHENRLRRLEQPRVHPVVMASIVSLFGAIIGTLGGLVGTLLTLWWGGGTL